MAIKSDPSDPGDPWGHVGIVDFDGMGISAGKDNVNRNMGACGVEVMHRSLLEANNE